MPQASLTDRIKDVEAHIITILSFQDMDILAMPLRDLLAAMKHQMIDARLAVRDYEYADTRAAQLEYAKEGLQYIEGLARQVVKASEHNIFGPADVAQLSAQLDSIKARLT